MPVTTIIHPVTGETFKLGRKRPNFSKPKLVLADYLLDVLPPAAPSCAYAEAARADLSKVYVNSQLSCCTASAAFHITDVMLDNSGQPGHFSDNDVVNFYSDTGDYVRGDPSTDNGADVQTVLNYWRKNGLVGGKHKLTAFAAVNPNNPNEIKIALELFEHLYFGIELPDEWVNPMPSGDGFVWDVAGPSNPNNGHAFCGIDYDTDGKPKIDTWGMVGKITMEAIAKYCASTVGGELWVGFSPDIVNAKTGKSPAGFDGDRLLADLKAITA
jgi:hypothetical protein